MRQDHPYSAKIIFYRGTLLLLLLSAYGCSSYYPLTREEVDAGMIPPETSIRITRDDGSTIESGAFRHAMVKEPSDFVTGVGLDRTSGKRFSGMVARSEIDSVRHIQVADPSRREQTYLVCWLANGTSIGFPEQDVLSIVPEQEPGLWCVGTQVESGLTKAFNGRIDPSDIRLIEEERIDALHPSLPTSGGRAAGQFLWFTLGIGAGPGPQSGHAPPAFLVEGSMLSKASLYSARMTVSFTVPGLSDHRPNKFHVLELAALYGVALKSQLFSLSISTGISYVRGSEDIDNITFGGNKITYSYATASFPLDIEAAITLSSHFGISLKYFSTSNSKKSWRGGALCVQLGNL